MIDSHVYIKFGKMKVKHYKYWYSIFELVLASFHFIRSSLSDCVGGWPCVVNADFYARTSGYSPDGGMVKHLQSQC